MKAVIMAGGEGRRLRAVSGPVPKPLVPLLGRPMMEHIILLLREQGFRDICVSLRYRAEDIISRFGDGSALGVRLSYRTENEPLGTAGGVKNCMDFCGDEDFLVISGDAACDFDLRLLADKHRKCSADVSIALYHCSEPLSYGLAVTDSSDMVRAFVEKPSWSRVVTDLVNTGIYVVSPEAMEKVPENSHFDFADDLFPLLLNSGRKILGLPMEGYWCDVGCPLSYYKCCADALEGRFKLSPGEGFRTDSEKRCQDRPEKCTECLELPCRSRAALMGALSEGLLDIGAEYSDGIHLSGSRFRMHISPLSEIPALRVAVSSQDSEYARELAVSAAELINALDL